MWLRKKIFFNSNSGWVGIKTLYMFTLVFVLIKCPFMSTSNSVFTNLFTAHFKVTRLLRSDCTSGVTMTVRTKK